MTEAGPISGSGLGPAYAATRGHLGTVAVLVALAAVGWWWTVGEMRGMDELVGRVLQALRVLDAPSHDRAPEPLHLGQVPEQIVGGPVRAGGDGRVGRGGEGGPEARGLLVDRGQKVWRRHTSDSRDRSGQGATGYPGAGLRVPSSRAGAGAAQASG